LVYYYYYYYYYYHHHHNNNNLLLLHAILHNRDLVMCILPSIARSVKQKLVWTEHVSGIWKVTNTYTYNFGGENCCRAATFKAEEKVGVYYR
jgi:hypothetical protein